MIESHSEPAPPPALPQATGFPQAFQYYADIPIDGIPLSAARVSCGGIPYHYKKLLRWKGLYQGGFNADLKGLRDEGNVKKSRELGRLRCRPQVL
jgi:hypothetical protein